MLETEADARGSAAGFPDAAEAATAERVKRRAGLD